MKPIIGMALALLIFSVSFTTYASCNTSSYVMYSSYDDSCPGGAFNCYYDLKGNSYQQDYYAIDYGHNTKYSCLTSEDPGSCS